MSAITGRLRAEVEIAAEYGVSQRTLARWRAAGLPHTRVNGRVMYRLSEVDAYLLERVEAHEEAIRRQIAARKASRRKAIEHREHLGSEHPEHETEGVTR